MGRSKNIMDELIVKIEEVVRKTISYDQGYPAAAEELINTLIPVFTKIVSYYAVPEMAEYAQDASYWPGQLERILNALNMGDDFALVDVLYNETRANILELKGILVQKGLIG
ncbi:MAG: hypothetical protein IKQ40_06825 [Lachnospiraceae bacterium]|nr:hypothetical protein [Lachnospiraceae bacterium]